MPRKVTSQWEFEGLIKPPAADGGKAASGSAADAREVLTVSDLTAQIRRLLEGNYGAVWVTGEVSNLRIQASGHSYFTLKDAGAQLSCVLFRGDAAGNRSALQDGQKVELKGNLTVYEPRGQYQLRVKSVALHGVGALQLAFEQLKRKLGEEGLFAPERKRPLPRYPRCVGIVTSPTGAALRDVLHVIQRRYPGLELILAPCRVQGVGAAGEIASAIEGLNRWAAVHRDVDLILVTRGGGSLEDLWAFNEEIVARAIFNSALPVVSAVGHEIDFTIGDFVADVRAATPSAAAEILTEGAHAARQFVAEAWQRMRQHARRRCDAELESLTQWRRRLARLHPRRILDDRMQYLDELQSALERTARLGWRRHATAWTTLRRRLAGLRPALMIERRRRRLMEHARRLSEQAKAAVGRRRGRWETLEARLRLLGPENVLARGYSITTRTADGAVIRSASEVAMGEEMRTRFETGERRSRVTG